LEPEIAPSVAARVAEENPNLSGAELEQKITDEIHAESERIMRSALGEVTVPESYRIYDEQFPDGIGNHKKKDYRPETFPTNESPTIPQEYQRYRDEFLSMTPSDPGTTWVRIDGNIPITDHGWAFFSNGREKPATELPVTVDFDSSGKAHFVLRDIYSQPA
jgi:hypothetical protein